MHITASQDHIWKKKTLDFKLHLPIYNPIPLERKLDKSKSLRWKLRNESNYEFNFPVYIFVKIAALNINQPTGNNKTLNN